MKISAEDFNNKYPIGTPVLWFPMDQPPILATRTSSEATELAAGDVVIMLEGTENRLGGSYIKVESIWPYGQKEFDAIWNLLEEGC